MIFSPDIPIGGFQKQSLIDFPGHISAVIFTRGCNFKCYYCHNHRLIDLQKKEDDPELPEILSWINQNKNLLDAVVITGGEPTLHQGLVGLINTFKVMGLKVKLDTNGTNPQMLEDLISNKLVDYIAMDIKGPVYILPYQRIAGSAFTASDLDKVRSSIQLLNASNIKHEYRITYDDLFSIADFKLAMTRLKGKVFLQKMEFNGIEVKTVNTKYLMHVAEIQKIDLMHR